MYLVQGGVSLLGKPQRVDVGEWYIGRSWTLRRKKQSQSLSQGCGSVSQIRFH